MNIDDKKVKQVLNKLESALESISRIDLWLPQVIDNAINGHHGTLDAVGLDRMRKEKREEEKIKAEIESLSGQVEEAQKQTKELQKQTRYLFWTLVITIIVNILLFTLK